MRAKVVIVGGGFGGLQAARGLGRAPVEVTLVDRRNFHLFQPLLYQVATGGLSPGDICAPLRGVLRHQKNTRVWLAEVRDLDVANRRVKLADGEIPYDFLIVATGARHHYFGREDWERFAPGLKTVEDATEMRRRILLAFEAAEREPDADKRRAWLTFVVVGAGPTGVELAGALGEIANHTLREDFRAIRPQEARILLVEHADRVLPSYPAALSAKAERALIRHHVRPLTGVKVVDLDAEGVVLERRGGARERIAAKTVLWAAGVRGSALGQVLAERAGAELDKAGRVLVGPDLSLPGRPEIFVIGDLACAVQNGVPLSAVAPVAMQQGRYVARAIQARLRGRAIAPFRYRDKGTLATIGRHHAVADFQWLRFDGFPAWVTWLFVHLLYLVGFQNRLLVLIQWAFHYFTFNRGARLITEPPAAVSQMQRVQSKQ
ncbi:MAG: NAD(P)/FAD-dependent oxidoreductase [Bryobacterales bacterium]|nr:NAD(P)/FAD-dependent oxidoreductase [Bryobacterales bacterium]